MVRRQFEIQCFRTSLISQNRKKKLPSVEIFTWSRNCLNVWRRLWSVKHSYVGVSHVLNVCEFYVAVFHGSFFTSIAIETVVYFISSSNQRLAVISLGLFTLRVYTFLLFDWKWAHLPSLYLLLSLSSPSFSLSPSFYLFFTISSHLSPSLSLFFTKSFPNTIRTYEKI